MVALKSTESPGSGSSGIQETLDKIKSDKTGASITFAKTGSDKLPLESRASTEYSYPYPEGTLESVQ
ncbi:hypothetical protein GCM10007047_32350 [Cerasicoccus arenae]|uniref:Uncharacterized protein n=1 Tax=Cerasicoccus arenae TaxID=424488 RepID=A0A8J3DKN5_9BACT|nr:hypothetical protein GCM10007047_32350 [Cerasicoccus arenae]